MNVESFRNTFVIVFDEEVVIYNESNVKVIINKPHNITLNVFLSTKQVLVIIILLAFFGYFYTLISSKHGYI